MKRIKIEIPWGVPSKKNSYEIRFSPIFWQSVRGIVEKLKKQGLNKLYWIGPSKEVKQFESNASWAIKAERPQVTSEIVIVRADVFVRNPLCDTDNLTGCIGDALQLGIPKFNDRQIKRWEIEKVIALDKRERVELEIEIIE
jgi:Holliday junction resolvase RusA-like endonuclease